MFNPSEVRIKMRKISRDGKEYYIGNCDLELNIVDTVLVLYPPKDEEEKNCTLVIKSVKDKDSDDDERTNS